MNRLKKYVLLFVFSNFLQMGVYLMGVVHFPQFLTREAGLGEMYAGALVGLIGLSTLVSVFPIGLLSDRVCPKKLFQVGQVLLIAFFLLVVHVRNPHLIWLVFLLGGLGSAGSRLILQVIYYKFLPEKRRAANVTLYASSGTLGFAFGGLGGGLLQSVGPAWPFYAGAAISFVVLCLSAALPRTRAQKIYLLDYVRDMIHPKVLPVTVLFALMGLHFGVEQYGFPKLVREELAISSAGMGSIFFVVGLSLGLAIFLIRELFEKRRKHFYFFGMGLFVSGLFQSLTAFADGYWSVLLLRVGHVMGDALIITMAFVVTATIFPKARMGGNIGAFRLINSVGLFGGAAATGFLIQAEGLPAAGMLSPYRAPFMLSGILMATLGVIFLLFRKSLGVAEREPLTEDT